MDNVITKRCWKQSHGCPWQSCKATNHTVTLRNLPNLASGTYTSTHRNSPEPASGTYTSTHQNSPEPSGSCLRNLHQHTPELSGTFRNLLPEPTPAHIGTVRNLPQPVPEPTPAHTRTLRNLPEPATFHGTYTSTHRNSSEPSGTFRNLPEPTPATHRNSPEPASGTYTSTYRKSPEPPAHTGTFRNLPPEPTPAHTGTLRNLPEPASGTGSCDPHRNTPELPCFLHGFLRLLRFSCVAVFQLPRNEGVILLDLRVSGGVAKAWRSHIGTIENEQVAGRQPIVLFFARGLG